MHRDNKEDKGATDFYSCTVKMRLQQVQKGIRYDNQPLSTLLLHSSHISLYTTNSIGVGCKPGHLLSELVVLCLHMSFVSVLTL